MRKKVYGSYRMENCPFCGGRALSKNGMGIPVCSTHKDAEVGELKCMCGEWLDLKESKWGVFGVCMKCGTVSWSRILELNPKAFQPPKPKEKEEFIVRSDDPLYFD